MFRSPKQNYSYYLYLCLEPFVFSLSSFPRLSTWLSWPSLPSWSSSFAPPLGMRYPISWSLWVKGLALRVSSINQNQTRAFNLPLFSNWWQPFHKDINWDLIEFMLLAQTYLPCVKEYGQVLWTPNGSNCSPYICAKSLDCSLHICLDRKYRRQFLPNDAKV